MIPTEQLPIIIVAAPFLSAVVVSILGLFKQKYCQPFAVFAMFLSFSASIATLQQVVNHGVIHYYLGGWSPPFGIEYVIDHLNAMVLTIVTFVGLIVSIYSKRSVEQELPNKIPHFFTLYLLQVTGLLGITITGDAFNLYVLLEITALTTYALIAVARGRAALSSFNYLIMGTIGASFYLLGVGHLYIMTGSLNMADIHQLLPLLHGSGAIFIAFLLILIGVWLKMAFFPMHGWLPNAYTYAPSSTSCLVAPLMTKVSVYVMIRIMFSVFSPEYTFSQFSSHDLIVWLSVIAIVGGSLFALTQKDFKKMLTYLIIAEVGYMVGGVWLANYNGIVGSVLHILNDSLMTLCMFLVVGIVVYKTKGHQLENLKGLYKKMPFTMAAFTIGALSLIGVPPTPGFFSKWYLILGAIDANHWEFLAALIFSSLVNVVLFFRIIEIAYFEPFSDNHHHEQPEVKIDEAPVSMLAPLLVVAIALLVIGAFTSKIVTYVIQYTVPSGL